MRMILNLKLLYKRGLIGQLLIRTRVQSQAKRFNNKLILKNLLKVIKTLLKKIDKNKKVKEI
jgi:hypothetical protein